MFDLHMHSSLSQDGEFTPSELVLKCAGAGVTHMALTDHNTVHGNAEAEATAEKAGIHFVPGVEFDSSFRGCDFHLLCYGADCSHPFFREVEDGHLAMYKAASRCMIEKLSAIGLVPDTERMEKISAGSYWPGVFFEECIEQALLDDPEYASDPRLMPYRPGGSRSDNPLFTFYLDYFTEGRPAHPDISYPDIGELIQGIHSAGGKAFLAHPGHNLKGRVHLLDDICRLGLDGIEAFSSYHSPADNAFYLEKAGEYGLLVSCGSDFHGRVKPRIPLGVPAFPPELEKQLSDALFS